MLTDCCCFPLRTGGLIIGWIGVVDSIIGIVTASAIVGVGYDVQTVLQVAAKHPVYEVPIVPLIILAVFLVRLICSGLLLFGIAKKRHLLLVAWLILQGIIVLALCVLICWGLAYIGSITLILLLLTGGGSIIGMEIYFGYAIFSLCKKIQMTENTKCVYRNA